MGITWHQSQNIFTEQRCQTPGSTRVKPPLMWLNCHEALSAEEKVLGIVRWMGANPTTTKQAYLPQTAIINHSALYNIERFSYLTMGKRLWLTSSCQSNYKANCKWDGIPLAPKSPSILGQDWEFLPKHTRQDQTHLTEKNSPGSKQVPACFMV